MFAKDRGLLRQFGEEPKAFTLSHFPLTLAQERAVRMTTPEETETIRKGVETALRGNLALIIREDCGERLVRQFHRPVRESRC